MANLLPSKERASLALERRRRLRATLFVLVSWLAILGTILLVPAGLVLLASKQSIDTRIESAEKLIEREKGANAGGSLSVTKEKNDILRANAALVLPHTLIERVVGLAPAGIALDHASFSRNEGTVTLELSGSATNRTMLVSFGDALKRSGLFTNVDIPIESLAQNVDLRFRLTLTLTEDAQHQL